MYGEGFAGLYFRDVCALNGVGITDAHGVMRWERAAAKWVDEQSTNEDEFEIFAKVAEWYNPNDGLEGLQGGVTFPTELTDTEYWLWGLELGVSGLSYVMAATGFYPVASCRSHVVRSWSPEPIVMFASDEERLKRLQPLVENSGCGLDADGTRGHILLVINAPSIVEMLALTESLFDARAEFRTLPKTKRKQSKEPTSRSTPRGPPTLL